MSIEYKEKTGGFKIFSKKYTKKQKKIIGRIGERRTRFTSRIRQKTWDKSGIP